MISEQELNSYRFLSGEDPTDEMLHAIMSEARDVAIERAEEAQKNSMPITNVFTSMRCKCGANE